MHFCDHCQNMYYLRIDTEDPNKLIHYCRNCGNEGNIENICISHTDIKKGQQSFAHIINKYTKLDPTLPRTNKILCPSKDCTTNTKDTPKEIIYIRYDDVNMKYVYLCSTCDTVWE
jgi:DNA-directed RNA polymerase subunit M/transcription elongation factor TFIIS